MLSMQNLLLDEIFNDLDVPESAYKAAERRYVDLGEWLKDASKAVSASFIPHIFAQGSFRLGTVTRPWKKDDYDLDLSCVLQEGITKSSHTQQQLKQILGSDLEKYRLERGIKDIIEEKRRCWRLNYQDDLHFHMDIVPAIPEVDAEKQLLTENILKTGLDITLARGVADRATAITDKEHKSYLEITKCWNISNQDGYALWFESRMRLATILLEKKDANIDKLPAYLWDSPLQRCIKLLKRHRDVMFENQPEGKPISIIITTLAARSYSGENSIETAMSNILSNMALHVKPTSPRIPNPVNPIEDYADKWAEDGNLEKNFRRWLDQAKLDFTTLDQSHDVNVLVETIQRGFRTRIDKSKIEQIASLLPKASAINSGSARTTSSGTIGSSGVENRPHKFYG